MEILYTGQIIIKDNLIITGTTPNTIQIGFPYRYGTHVLKATAYDQNNNALEITTGIQLQTQTGFYAAQITLPQGTNNFTVAFILDNQLLTPNSNGISTDLDYPAYPSLTTTASQCNVTVLFPPDTSSVTITKPDGEIETASYGTANLAAFTYAPANANFQSMAGELVLVTIPSLSRQVNVGPDGSLTCTDTYRVTNNGPAIASLIVNLPVGTTGLVARDGFGRILTAESYQSTSQLLAYNVTLVVALSPGESGQLILDYGLGKVSAQGGKYVVNVDLFPRFDYYIEEASVTVTPPEGATIELPKRTEVGSSADLVRNVFQESFTVNRKGVTYLDSNLASEDMLQVTFNYSALWVAFRPTSWIWVIAVVGCIIAALWTRPRIKAPKLLVVPKMTAGLSPEHIRVFTEAYEERNKIVGEIRLLEARVQRGRMPRRRYKVQRQSLEQRLESLGHTISEIKLVLQSSGGVYADFVRQLEKAEVELEEVSLGIDNIETKHATGELPIDAYRKQLTEFERRKAKAENVVNGLLLRLRQEMR